MKRKLFSAMLSAFALLLLMGAAADTDPAYAIVAEEESAVSQEMELETEAQLPEDFPEPEDFGNPIPEAPPEPVGNSKLLINGEPAPEEIGRSMQKGITYVALDVLAKELEPAAQITWDGSTVTVVTEQLTMTAKVGQLYVVANGRYLYVPEAVQLTQAGQAAVPLRVAAEAFGAEVGYTAETGVATVTSGSGTILSGDEYYNQDDLFWLSRVIYRESGNQSLEGKIAVGNVVLNRVHSAKFPNTVYEVIFQRGQFTPVSNGSIHLTPNAESVIAAKLCLDGANTVGNAIYFLNPRYSPNSWAARTRTHVATIGAHAFYQ